MAKKRTPEKNFHKTLLQSYILTNCKRRLFLELGMNKPHLWFDPVRSVPSTPPDRLMFQQKYLKDKGKEYENKVYSYLMQLSNSHFKPNVSGGISSSPLTKEALETFHDIYLKNPNNTLMLLEYQFEIPEAFFDTIFKSKNRIKILPVDFSDQRPDIIFLGNQLNELVDKVYEITYDGVVLELPKERLQNRCGISVFDIKYIQEENVSKKNFLEILYYLKTLAVYIKRKNLDNKFYVRANYNGILPLRDEESLQKIKAIPDLFTTRILNNISWKEANRIYDVVLRDIQRLWKKAPCPIEAIKTNIHQGCGYCQYIEDCKITLGMIDGASPRDWSLKLIPLTSQSIAQELIKEYNLHTIGNLVDNLDKIKVESIPKPLYSELPSLRLKTKALLIDQIIYPTQGQAQSFAIPRYSPIALNFDVEYDRNNDKIFATCIFLTIFISSKLKYHGIFNNWCKIWKESLKEKRSNGEIANKLNQYLIREIPLETVIRFRSCLEKLRTVQFSLKGERTIAGTSITYRFAKVNEDDTSESEARLAIQTIHRFHLLFEICNILEDYIVINGFEQDTYYGPDTSVFYWSPNQLENFQNMLQRNVKEILDNPHARAAYESIFLYFSPSETEVSHPYQHKKMFDVQGFAESFVGFPDIINYTWHGIAGKLFNLNFSPQFWIPHFNFLDLTNWLRFLAETDPKKKKEIKDQINKQLILKVSVINNIRHEFQKQGTFVISRNARVISRYDYNSAILPDDYHDIAFVWYLFSRLNATLQQWDNEHYRTMFPEYSVGKLNSANIINLKGFSDGGKKYYYTFDTVSISSNMKVKEGAQVLLIPNAKRGLKIDRSIFRWRVGIDKIEWDPVRKGYHFTTKLAYADIFSNCKDEGINPKTQKWYIYPLSSDPWSSKLYNDKRIGLFDREEFGTSWLGELLACLWHLRSDPILNLPYSWKFTTPSIYLYAPELLTQFNELKQDYDLVTKICPKPDISQEVAIKNSLRHIISGILGPPGTGKSQTIAALIDEFLIQYQKKEKPVKILITSFSYAALRVVLDKIRTSKDKNGKPTPSSLLQMIFIRSDTQTPIKEKIGCRNVDDLLHYGSTWKLNGRLRSVTKQKLLEESLEESCIIFANAHHLYYLQERVEDDFAFDLICVDEASQLPTDYFMSSLQYIYKYSFPVKPLSDLNRVSVSNLNLEIEEDKNYYLTKVVIVGDHNQLPPVRVKTPPKNLEPVLDSLFSYYVQGHSISSKQLKVNYRSHEDIVAFTALLGLYKDLTAFKVNAKALLKGDINKVSLPWIKEILDPNKVVCSILHNRKFEIGISVFEAFIVSQLILSFYNMRGPKNEREEVLFWNEGVGVVAPHNAQGRTIIRYLFDIFQPISYLSEGALMNHLKNTVYSVEKFQGSDRELIISSIGLSDLDKISAEEEFIFNLNRFNVLTSRAKHKVIFISSNKFLRYIPDERVILEKASKIYTYVQEFCNKNIELKIDNEKSEKEKIMFRFKK